MKRFLCVLKETFLGYFERELGISAASLSYYFLFSVFPLAISVGSLLFMTDAGIEILGTAGEALLPDMLQNLFSEYYEHIIQRDNTIYFSLGAFFSFYFITRYINCVKKKIREIYDDASEHSIVFEWILSFVFSVLLAAGLYLTFILQSLGEKFFGFLSENFFSFPGHFVNGWLILRFAAIGGYVFVLSLILYSVVPYRKMFVKHSVPGAVVSSGAWMLTSLVFSEYIDNVSRYSVLYGPLAVFMVLMLWLYLINNIILIGALINRNLKLKKL